MAEVRNAARKFKYGSLDLEDPGMEMSPDEVRNFYAGVYPELTQSVIEGPEYNDDGSITYSFSKAVGTKG